MLTCIATRSITLSLTFTLAAGLTACDSTNHDHGGNPANDQQIAACKASCDKQKFFNCYDAACGNYLPEPTPTTSDECVKGCQAFVAEGCAFPVDCQAGCASLGASAAVFSSLATPVPFS